MASSDSRFPMKGSCGCGELTYTMHAAPMWIHCCHCTQCQVQTGSAFVLNGIIEHSLITLDNAKEPEMAPMPAPQEGGQQVARCPACKTAIWSTYGSLPLLRFVRLGTLDKDATGQDPSKGQLEPDAHIYTSTKVPWVSIPPGKLVLEDDYDMQKVWTPQAWERYQKVMEQQRQMRDSEPSKST